MAPSGTLPRRRNGVFPSHGEAISPARWSLTAVFFGVQAASPKIEDGSWRSRSPFDGDPRHSPARLQQRHMLTVVSPRRIQALCQRPLRPTTIKGGGYRCRFASKAKDPPSIGRIPRKYVALKPTMGAAGGARKTSPQIPKTTRRSWADSRRSIRGSRWGKRNWRGWSCIRPWHSSRGGRTPPGW
jgi:hypothetical protein